MHIRLVIHTDHPHFHVNKKVLAACTFYSLNNVHCTQYVINLYEKMVLGGIDKLQVTLNVCVMFSETSLALR